MTVFNTLFTSLPVIFLGIFKQDYTKEVLLRQPELYRYGQDSHGFGIKIYLLWAMTAILKSALLSFSVVALYAPTTHMASASSTVKSSPSAIFPLGTLSFSACIIIIATKLQFIEVGNKSWTTALAIGLSIGGWATWDVTLSGVYSNNSVYDVKAGLFERWGKQGAWWLALLLIVVEIWLFEFVVLGVRGWCEDQGRGLESTEEMDHTEYK